jgi:hypothetical protein
MARLAIFGFDAQDGSGNWWSVSVYWNDITSQIETDAYNDAGEAGQPSNLNHEGVGLISGYRFCEGFTLTQFTGVSYWPFAERQQIENSGVCGYVVCDLAFVPCELGQNTGCGIVVQKESKTGAEDATATIYATSSNGPIEYSIDNKTWQRSNVFTGLKAGGYTAYLNDAGGCKASQYFAIAAPNTGIEYGPRYMFSYRDAFGNTSTLKIYKNGYIGPVEELDIAGSEPVIIDYPGTEIADPVKSSSLNFMLVARTDFKFLELFSINDFEHRVDLMKNGNLYWRGFVLTDQYSESYKHPPYEVSVMATDGLSILRNIPFTEDNDLPFTGELSLLEIIRLCLAKMRYKLPMYTSVDIYAEGMDQQQDVLSQVYVNVDTFYQKGEAMSCFEVLNECLKVVGAYIFQEGGAWHILRIEANKEPYQKRHYDEKGQLVEDIMYNPLTQLLTPRQAAFVPGPFWIEGRQHMEIRPAYRDASAEVTNDILENIIPFGEFAYDDFPTRTSVQGWEVTANISRVIVDAKTDNYGLGIIGQHGFMASVLPYIKSKPVRFDQGASTMVFSLRYNLSTLSPLWGDEQPATFAVVIRSGPHQLKKDGNWVLDPNDDLERIRITIDSVDQWHEWQMQVNRYHVAGNELTIKIYQVRTNQIDVNALVFDYVRVELLPDYLAPEKKSGYYIQNSKNFLYSPAPISLHLNNLDNRGQARLVYRNVLLTMKNGLFALAGRWNRVGKQERVSLIQLLLESLVRLHQKPTQQLSGALRGRVNFEHTIQDDLNESRIFYIRSLTKYDKSGNNEVVMAEIGQGTMTLTVPKFIYKQGDDFLLKDGQNLDLKSY